MGLDLTRPHVVPNERDRFAALDEDGKVRFVSAAPLFDALSRVKRNVPLSLDRIENNGQ